MCNVRSYSAGVLITLLSLAAGCAFEEAQAELEQNEQHFDRWFENPTDEIDAGNGLRIVVRKDPVNMSITVTNPSSNTWAHDVTINGRGTCKPAPTGPGSPYPADPEEKEKRIRPGGSGITSAMQCPKGFYTPSGKPRFHVVTTFAFEL